MVIYACVNMILFRSKYFFTLILMFCSVFMFAQGEIETLREPDKYNENSFGFKLNSNGWGLDYRFSQRINHRLRNFYEAEIGFVKDPKEIKVVNPYLTVQKKFVFGKMNSFQHLKLGVGFNRMLLEKRDRGSISVHHHWSAGGILGVEKPIYYELVDSTIVINDKRYYYTGIHRLDIHRYNPTDVVSKAPFVNGLSEIQLVPGIFIKTGFSFDFSRNVLKSNVIESGIAFDYYFRSVEIMAENYNNMFLSVYISYRFGSKYDSQLSREARKDL